MLNQNWRCCIRTIINCHMVITAILVGLNIKVIKREFHNMILINFNQPTTIIIRIVTTWIVWRMNGAFRWGHSTSTTWSRLCFEHKTSFYKFLQWLLTLFNCFKFCQQLSIWPFAPINDVHVVSSRCQCHICWPLVTQFAEPRWCLIFFGKKKVFIYTKIEIDMSMLTISSPLKTLSDSSSLPSDPTESYSTTLSSTLDPRGATICQTHSTGDVSLLG